MKIHMSRGVFSLFVPVAIASAVFFAEPKSARATWDRISGTLTTHDVPCSTLCTAGTLTGDIAGNFSWTMSSMTATANPDVFVLTGSVVIVTPSGTLTGNDVTLWNVATGQFTDQVAFTGGTGGYAGAVGWMSLIGSFADAQGQSNYRGLLRD